MTTQLQQIYWQPDASGNWTNASDWSGGEPTSTDDQVFLEPAGTSPFTVTYDTTDSIYSLASNQYATLRMTGGTLTLAADAVFGGTVNLKAGTLDLQHGWQVTGGFSLSAGATVDVAAGTLEINGGSLDGSITGNGNIYLEGDSTTTIGKGFSCTAATLEIGVNGDGFPATLALLGNASYNGNFLIDNYSGNSAVLDLNGHTMTISGTSTLDGNVVGPGTLVVEGNSTVAQGGYSDLGILDGATVSDQGTMTQYQVTSLDGTLAVQKGAVWNIVTDTSIDATGATTVLTNAGTFEKTDSTGISYIGANVTNSGTFAAVTGTLDVNYSFTNTGLISGNNIIVNGAFSSTGTIDVVSLTLAGGGTLGGTLAGTGTIDLTNSAGYTVAANTSLDFATLDVNDNSTLTLKSNESFAGVFNLSAYVEAGRYDFTLTGPASLSGTITGTGKLSTSNATLSAFFVYAGSGTWLDTGAITQNANIQLGGGSTDTVALSIGKGDIYNVTGGYWLGNPNGNDTGLATITNKGLFEMTGSSGTAQIFNTDFTTSGTLLVDSGLILSGPSSVLGGKIEGAGALALYGGWTLESGTRVTIADLQNEGSGTLTASTSLSDIFTQGGGGSIDLASNSLTLTGADTLAGLVGGGGTLTLSDATLSGFALYGDSTLVDSGTITQTGGDSIGQGSTDACTLTILSGATWQVSGNQWLGNPNQSDTGVATINNQGTFEAAAGDVISVFHTNFDNTGTLLANGSIYLDGNSATLGGTLSGTGYLQLATDWTLESTAVVTVAQLDNEGAGTLTANLSYGGTFTNGSGAMLDLAGNSLTLTGPATLDGEIGGTGTLSLANATETNFTLYGNTTEIDTGTVTLQSGGQLGAGATDEATLSILADATFTLAGNLWLGNPNANDTGTATILNSGTLQATGTDDIWHTNLTSTGTLTSNGYLGLFYQFATLGGTINGTGEVSLQENFSLAGGTAISVATFENDASGTLLGNVTDTGIWLNDTGATLTLNGDTLTLSGGGSLSGLIGGPGVLAFTGSATTIESGGAITATSLTLAGASSLTLAENLTYGGIFSAAGATSASIALGTNTLTLSGPTTLDPTSGSLALDGAGTLALGGTATVGEVSVGGSATLLASGAETQNAFVTLGDATGSGTLAISAAGTWNVATVAGIRVSGHGDAVVNDGLFEKISLTGASKIAADFTNNGTVEVTSGSLVFTGGFTNDGVIIGTETTSNGTVTITAATPLSPADFGLSTVPESHAPMAASQATLGGWDTSWAHPALELILTHGH